MKPAAAAAAAAVILFLAFLCPEAEARKRKAPSIWGSWRLPDGSSADISPGAEDPVFVFRTTVRGRSLTLTFRSEVAERGETVEITGSGRGFRFRERNLSCTVPTLLLSVKGRLGRLKKRKALFASRAVLRGGARCDDGKTYTVKIVFPGIWL